jgi:AcrR family transcriptional regulator
MKRLDRAQFNGCISSAINEYQVERVLLVRMDLMKEQPTKQHILRSTIDAIEKHGLDNLTTRLIAEEAGVNNAALHYYYGTKDNLVEAALNQTANRMLDDTRGIMSGDDSIEVRLRDLLVYIIDGVEKFPNIIRAHLMEPFYYADRREELTQLLGSWIAMAENAVRESGAGRSPNQIKLSLDMIFSYIIMYGLFKTKESEDAWMDLQDPVTRERFLRQAVDMLI